MLQNPVFVSQYITEVIYCSNLHLTLYRLSVFNQLFCFIMVMVLVKQNIQFKIKTASLFKIIFLQKLLHNSILLF